MKHLTGEKEVREALDPANHPASWMGAELLKEEWRGLRNKSYKTVMYKDFTKENQEHSVVKWGVFIIAIILGVALIKLYVQSVWNISV